MRKRYIDIISIGDIFGSLTVLEILPKSKNPKVKVRCVCGKETTPFIGALLSGGTRSCGCQNKIKHMNSAKEQSWKWWYAQIKRKAIARNLDFCLTLDEVKEICSGDCSYCGIPPQSWSNSANNYIRIMRKAAKAAPDLELAKAKIIKLNGIDRVDSNRPYTKDNCVACCFNCNVAKLDMSVTEFKEWVKRVYNYLWK